MSRMSHLILALTLGLFFLFQLLLLVAFPVQAQAIDASVTTWVYAEECAIKACSSQSVYYQDLTRSGIDG